MAHSNYGITAPVSFADVNSVLGTSHTDLGNLCKDSHINKWARYKPFSAPILGLPTESQRQDYYYGLLPPLMKKQSSFFNELAWDCMCGKRTVSINAGGLWDYVKPSGGVNSPYRLQDFVDVSGTTAGYEAQSIGSISVTPTTGSNVGCIDKGNHELELALQTRNYITFVFSELGYPHIPIWAFFQRAYNDTYTNPIRIRIGIFEDNGSTPWYERSATVVAQTIATPTLTANGMSALNVDVSFSDSKFSSNTNKIYYVVIGFQRCSSDGVSVDPNGIGSAYGLLPPYSETNDANQTWPFLWKVRLANYFTRTIKFEYGNNTLGYGTNSWFTYTMGYFSAHWISGDLFLVCKISLNATALTFVNQNGTSGGSGTKIQFAATCPIAHGETLYYATPANSSRQTPTTVAIPTGSESQFQTLYMWIDGNVRPSTAGYYSINIMSRTYTGSTPSGDWVNASSLSIRIT